MAQVTASGATLAGLAAIVMMGTNPSFDSHDLYNPPAIIRKSQQNNTGYGFSAAILYASAASIVAAGCRYRRQ
ncbi:hypothetical protein HY640_01975 [Candidatus Woesearchaeota archaeon]|nr:hypothetical protein [Candidatus Woesearchaeota archaeon]